MRIHDAVNHCACWWQFFGPVARQQLEFMNLPRQHNSLAGACHAIQPACFLHHPCMGYALCL